MINKKITTILKILVSFGLLYLLFRNTDLKLFIETIRSINPTAFIAAMLLYTSTQVLSTFRWSLFLSYSGVELSFFKLLSLYFIGMFFNNFLPTAIGGDVVKGYYLYRTSGKGGVSMASIFVDRYTGLTSLAIITLFSLIFGYPYIKDTFLPWLLFIFVFCFLGISLILWVEQLHNWALTLINKINLYGINEKIEAFYNALMKYREAPKVLATGFGISIVLQVIGIFVFYVIARGFGMSVPLLFFFLFVPLALTASMIPISLAGLGLREGVFVFLFAKINVSSAEAMSLSLAWFIVIVLASLVGWIEYMRLDKNIQMEDIKG